MCVCVCVCVCVKLCINVCIMVSSAATGSVAVDLRGGGVGGQGYRVADLQPRALFRGDGHRVPSHAGVGVSGPRAYFAILYCMYGPRHL